MAFSFTKHFRTRATPQSEPVPGLAMVPNSAGGYAFAVDAWKRLERFLILGNEGGSYYATERRADDRKHAGSGPLPERRCGSNDPDNRRDQRLGAGAENDPAIFALAIAAGTGHSGSSHGAAQCLPHGHSPVSVRRGGRGVPGWGRGLARPSPPGTRPRPPDSLAFQVAKYQQRNGWSHRDLLRLAHPVTADPVRQAVYRWVVGGKDALGPREVKRGDRTVLYPDVTAGLPGSWPRWMKRRRWIDRGLSP